MVNETSNMQQVAETNIDGARSGTLPPQLEVEIAFLCNSYYFFCYKIVCLNRHNR